MPLDAIFLKGLTDELSRTVKGMKIDRVFQPEHDLFILNLRGRGTSARLLMSSGSGARVHLTDELFQNPEKPSAFCMLLRKHLHGAVIADITQPESERAIIFELDALDAFGEYCKKTLVVEFISRGENLFLIDSDGIIIDCLRRRGVESSALPGLLYRLPTKQDKLPFLTTPPEKRRELWFDASPDMTADAWILSRFSGVSPLICREMCYRAFGESPRVGDLDEGARLRLPAAMDALTDSLEAGDYEPVMLLRGEEPFDFSFMPISQYGNAMKVRRFQGFSELLEAYHAQKDRTQYLRRRSADISKMVKRVQTRLSRKLVLQRDELSKAEDRELARMRGDIITSNLHLMRKGMSELIAPDFYTEGFPDVTIPLDPLKTPQQNAAAYYKRYSKAKTAEKILLEQIELGEEELRYLESVLSEFDFAETPQDIDDIRAELVSAGYIKKSNQRGSKVKPRAPLRFVSDTGFEIRVGRNNLQNDELTFKLAKKSDIWLHTQKIHGSHVVITCAAGEEPDDATLREAASIAVYFSSARRGDKVPVDYTQARCVRRIPRALPGAVYYTRQKTVIAEADEKVVSKLSDLL